MSVSLDAALQAHRDGRLDEAETGYRALLAGESGNADVLQLLALLRAQCGDVGQAEDFFRQALDKDPEHAEAHNNLGNLRQMQGRLDDAVECYRRAVGIRPVYPMAQFNLAVALRKNGQIDEAATVYRKVLKQSGDFVEAHHNLGMILQEQGKADAAADCFRKALELRPRDGGLHEQMGAVRRSQGRWAEAAEYFERAAQLDPTRARLRHLVDAYRGNTTGCAPREYVEDLFDSLAPEYEDRLVHTLNYQAPKHLRAMLDEIVGTDVHFENALDLGCGTGLAGQAFAGTADRLVGVDMSAGMIELAKQKNVYDELTVSTIEEYLKSTDATFDLVIAADVLNYLGDLESTFALLRSRAGDSTHMLFTTEIGEAGAYTLTRTGRYAHSARYVASVASDNGFVVVHRAVKPLRTEDGAFVTGNCFLLIVA